MEQDNIDMRYSAPAEVYGVNIWLCMECNTEVTFLGRWPPIKCKNCGHVDGKWRWKRLNTPLPEDEAAHLEIRLQSAFMRICPPSPLGVVEGIEPDGFVVVLIPFGPRPGRYTFRTFPDDPIKRGDLVDLVDWKEGSIRKHVVS